MGSNQVWRQEFVPTLDDCFLGSIPEASPVRRIACTASSEAGPMNIAPEQTILHSELLSCFVAVSTRESSTVPLLTQRSDATARWVLGPTVLFAREEYIDQLGLREEPSGEVFAYMLTHTPHKEELVRQIAESHHTTYHLFAPWRHWTKCGQELEACILPLVERWFERILNAQCVVTDSFHGVAFSFIFGKPFVAIVNNHDGCSRFDTPIRPFGLEHYQGEAYELVSSSECYDVKTIAWTLVRHRITSIGFLEGVLH